MVWNPESNGRPETCLCVFVAAFFLGIIAHMVIAGYLRLLLDMSQSTSFFIGLAAVLLLLVPPTLKICRRIMGDGEWHRKQ